MSIYLKRYGFAVTKYDKRDTGISGSSRFANILSWIDEDLRPKSKQSLFRDNNKTEKTEIKTVEKTPEKPTDERNRQYGVNRKNLLDRLNAYVCLSRSKRFLAFYSISFPAGTNDEVVAKIWNSCLTSLREKLSLRSYIWVMERQRNGTMHYHMLTNDFLRVRAVNAIVAECIDYYVKKGLAWWGNSSVTSYNGVDVESISKRASKNRSKYAENAYRMVVSYVTKYMSKNKKLESRRQWHCSRLVSALFVTACLTADEVDIIFEKDSHLLERKKIVESEHGYVVIFAAIDSIGWKDTIGYWNDKIYCYFEEHSLW